VDLAILSDDLIVAYPLPNGFTWTLASRLGQMLTKVELQFGQRNRSFTVLGIEFRDGVSQLWFPGNCGHVVIQLGLAAMQDPIRAKFQLAHECVHLLDPAPGGTNNLEEGIATQFSLDFLEAEFGIRYQTGNPKYDNACNLIRSLRAAKGDAAKELRRLHGTWRGISKQEIMAMCPSLDVEIADQLAATF
jgi:hypothetical protein